MIAKNTQETFILFCSISVADLEGTEPAPPPPPWATDRGRDDRPTPDK